MVRMGPTVTPWPGPRTGPNRIVLSPPPGFGWTPPFSVIQTGPSTFTTDLNTDSLKVTTAATRYVAIATGSNANNGSSWALAHKSLWDALNDAFTAGVAVTIYVEGSADPNNPTMYDYDNAWRSALAVDANVIVVSDRTTLAPGYAISSTYMAPGGADLGTWALTADAAGPHVYEATLAAAPNAVIDATVLNARGAPTKLTSRASIALVEANPGSYYHAAGKLYVRASDSRAPDAKLRALKASVVNGHVNTSTVRAYLQGFTFEGGNARALYLQNFTSVALVDCKAWCAQAAGIDFTNTTTGQTFTIISVRCSCLDNYADGFQYTGTAASTVIHAAEIDCIGKGNSGAGTDQGSTAHFTAGNTSVNVIRVGGTYAGNKTQEVADVGGCKVWNAGCRFGDGGIVGYFCGDASTTWLHGCTLTANSTDIQTDNAGGIVRVAGLTYAATTTGTGTVERYVP